MAGGEIGHENMGREIETFTTPDFSAGLATGTTGSYRTDVTVLKAMGPV